MDNFHLYCASVQRARLLKSFCKLEMIAISKAGFTKLGFGLYCAYLFINNHFRISHEIIPDKNLPWIILGIIITYFIQEHNEFHNIQYWAFFISHQKTNSICFSQTLNSKRYVMKIYAWWSYNISLRDVNI